MRPLMDLHSINLLAERQAKMTYSYWCVQSQHVNSLILRTEMIDFQWLESNDLFACHQSKVVCRWTHDTHLNTNNSISDSSWAKIVV